VVVDETRSPESAGTRTLVLGLGNPVLSDDSAGLHVVRGLAAQQDRWPAVEFDEAYCGGLGLMERLVGYDRVILVDAIVSGEPPGTVRTLGVDDLPTQHSGSAHDVTLPAALAVGREAGARLPRGEAIRLVAIEAADVTTLREGCTAPVSAGVARAIEVVRAMLDAWTTAR
jgi:hydrogenase maturation protease